MESNIIGAIIFIAAFIIGFCACIPPLKQSVDDGFKPGIFISILFMLIMLAAQITMIWRLISWLI